MYNHGYIVRSMNNGWNKIIMVFSIDPCGVEDPPMCSYIMMSQPSVHESPSMESSPMMSSEMISSQMPSETTTAVTEPSSTEPSPTLSSTQTQTPTGDYSLMVVLCVYFL